MTAVINESATLDLSHQGSYQDIDVSTVDTISVAGIDNDRWGATAVVEVAKLYGDRTVSFGSAATIDTSTNTEREGLDVSGGVNIVRAFVKTADPAAGHGRLLITGKETQ